MTRGYKTSNEELLPKSKAMPQTPRFALHMVMVQITECVATVAFFLGPRSFLLEVTHC